MRFRLRTLLMAISISIFVTPAILAELWPTFEEAVDRCVLIVHCRTEIQNDHVRYKVLETWKGVYSPELFYEKPEEGYLYTNTLHGNESPTDGREVVFFFTAHNHPRWTEGRLLDHSTSFVIKNKKLVWESTADFGRHEYTLGEFRAKVLDRVRAEFAKATMAQILKAQGK